MDFSEINWGCLKKSHNEGGGGCAPQHTVFTSKLRMENAEIQKNAEIEKLKVEIEKLKVEIENVMFENRVRVYTVLKTRHLRNLEEI